MQSGYTDACRLSVASVTSPAEPAPSAVRLPFSRSSPSPWRIPRPADKSSESGTEARGGRAGEGRGRRSCRNHCYLHGISPRAPLLTPPGRITEGGGERGGGGRRGVRCSDARDQASPAVKKLTGPQVADGRPLRRHRPQTGRDIRPIPLVCSAILSPRPTDRPCAHQRCSAATLPALTPSHRPTGAHHVIVTPPARYDHDS